MIVSDFSRQKTMVSSEFDNYYYYNYNRNFTVDRAVSIAIKNEKLIIATNELYASFTSRAPDSKYINKVTGLMREITQTKSRDYVLVRAGVRLKIDITDLTSIKNPGNPRNKVCMNGFVTDNDTKYSYAYQTFVEKLSAPSSTVSSNTDLTGYSCGVHFL